MKRSSRVDRLRAAGASMSGAALQHTKNKRAAGEGYQAISVTPQNRTRGETSAGSDEDDSLKIIREEFNIGVQQF